MKRENKRMRRNRIMAAVIAGVLVLSMVIGLITPFLF